MNLKIPVTDSDQQQGNREARVVLVEYGDYECPHCGAAHPVVKKLQHYYGRDMLFVFRNFPLAEMHPHAMAAAAVAEASALQDKFWPVHDLIFENQENLYRDELLGYAYAAGVETEKLLRDIQSAGIKTKIEKDREGGLWSGVNGTPTFFINGRRHDGEYEFHALKAAIEKY